MENKLVPDTGQTVLDTDTAASSDPVSAMPHVQLVPVWEEALANSMDRAATVQEVDEVLCQCCNLESAHPVAEKQVEHTVVVADSVVAAVLLVALHGAFPCAHCML